MLTLPDFTKPFSIECDASNVGIGAVLAQDNHPIEFLSKPLAPKHQTLSMYDKEMLAVVFAVHKCRPYLIGHHFKILTDHQTLKYFLDQRITTPAQQKWLLKLLGYNYTLEYRPGASNAAADALSRRFDLLSLMGLSQPLFDCVFEIQTSYAADPFTAELLLTLHQAPHRKGSFQLQGDLLYYKAGLFVPATSPWRALLLHERFPFVRTLWVLTDVQTSHS